MELLGIQTTSAEDFRQAVRQIIRQAIQEELKSLNLMSSLETYLTVKEVASLLKVSTNTIHSLRKKGKLPFAMVNKRVIIRRTDVDTYINNSIQVW